MRQLHRSLPGLSRRALLMCALVLAAGCGGEDAPSTGRQVVATGDGDATGYGAQTDVVVTADGTTYIISGRGEGCVQIDGACQDLAEAEGRYCGQEGGQTDVVLDGDGAVAEVICYPPPEEAAAVDEVIVTEDGVATLPQNANGSVIIFDAQTEGEAVEGDMTLNGERMTLFGRGVDETLLVGQLTIASNHSRLRGLTINGGLRYTKNANSSALSFVTVRGDVSIASNGFRGAALTVFGDVTVTGNDARLTNLGISGEWSGGGATCAGCYSIADEDEDFIVDEGERADWVDGAPPQPAARDGQ